MSVNLWPANGVFDTLFTRPVPDSPFLCSSCSGRMRAESGWRAGHRECEEDSPPSILLSFFRFLLSTFLQSFVVRLLFLLLLLQSRLFGETRNDGHAVENTGTKRRGEDWEGRQKVKKHGQKFGLSAGRRGGSTDCQEGEERMLPACPHVNINGSVQKRRTIIAGRKERTRCRLTMRGRESESEGHRKTINMRC